MIRMTRKTNLEKYVFFSIMVIRYLLPSYFTDRLGSSILNPMAIFSIALMLYYIFSNKISYQNKGRKLLYLIIICYVTSILTTYIHGENLQLALINGIYIIIECWFLVHLLEKKTDVDVFLHVVRDVTLVFVLINLGYGIINPQGIPDYNSLSAISKFIYGNVNSTTRYVMPGLCSSLLIDLKQNKRFSFKSAIFFISFGYFCFRIYFMATSFVGYLFLLAWILFSKFISSKYKKVYLAIIIAVTIIETFIVFLFGQSQLATYITSLFSMKSGFSGREDLWARAIYSIQQSPYFGNGVLIPDKMLYIIGNKYGSHNYYLDVMFQRGIIGFIPVVALILLPLSCKAKKLTNETYVMLGVCASYLIMFLMEPFIGTEMLHIPIFFATMYLIKFKHDEVLGSNSLSHEKRNRMEMNQLHEN